MEWNPQEIIQTHCEVIHSLVEANAGYRTQINELQHRVRVLEQIKKLYESEIQNMRAKESVCLMGVRRNKRESVCTTGA